MEVQAFYAVLGSENLVPERGCCLVVLLLARFPCVLIVSDSHSLHDVYEWKLRFLPHNVVISQVH